MRRKKILRLTAVLIPVVLIVGILFGMRAVKYKEFPEESSCVNTESIEGMQEPAESVSMLMVEVVNDITGARKAVGTGIVYQVDEDGVWIATAAHVLETQKEDESEDKTKIILHMAGVSVVCNKWVEVKQADLAYFYLDREEFVEDIVPVPIQRDKASYDELSLGDKVTAIGYSEGVQTECQGVLSENWIYVEDFGQYMMVAECGIKPGMSGGGLYDEKGNFIGMICGGNTQGELVAMPWHVMQACLDEFLQN